MKNRFQVTGIQTLLDNLNLQRRLPIAKKTPWYRKTYRNVPVAAFGLMLPFAIFVVWKLAQLAFGKSAQDLDPQTERHN